MMPDAALYLSNEAVTTPVISLDESRRLRAVRKRSARLRYGFLEDALSCENLGPNGLQELLLRYYAVVMLREISKHPNSTRLQWDDTIVAI